jgi:hypothetical protein
MANGKWQMANGFSFVILQLSNRKPFEFCLLPNLKSEFKWQTANGFSFAILQLNNRKPFEFCLLPNFKSEFKWQTANGKWQMVFHL